MTATPLPLSSSALSQGSTSSTHHLELPYPEVPGQPFRCPVCSVCYKMYTSFTRHLLQQHEGLVTLSFMCTHCTYTSSSKRSVSVHHSKTHHSERAANQPGPSTSGLSASAASESSIHQCSYCSEVLPSRRSLGQHIRNQHAAEASRDRAEAAANTTSRLWTPAEHALFLDALERLGPSSNPDIARAVGTKSTKQVANHKRIFLRNNPNWMSHHPPPAASRLPAVDEDDEMEDPPSPESAMDPDDPPSPSSPPDDPPNPPSPPADEAATGSSALDDVPPSQQDLFSSTPPRGPDVGTPHQNESAPSSRSPSPPRLPRDEVELSTQQRAALARADALLESLSRHPALQAAETDPADPDSTGVGVSSPLANVLSPPPPSPGPTHVLSPLPPSPTVLPPNSIFVATPPALSSLSTSDSAGHSPQPPADSENSPPPPPPEPAAAAPSSSPSTTGQATAPSVHPNDADPPPPDNPEEREEKLRELRERRMTEFTSTAGHLCGRMLTDEEWAQFVMHVDTLVADLSHIVPHQPPTNPTTHWRRRQRRNNNPTANQRRRLQRRGQTSSQPSGPSRPRPPTSRDALSQPAPAQHGAVSGSQPAPVVPPAQPSSSHPPTDDPPQLSSQDGSADPHPPSPPAQSSSQRDSQASTSNTQDTSSSNSRSNQRRRWANEARKFQRWYRANKKRCMRTILGEKPASCEIPAATLQDHFTKPAVSLGESLPSWLDSSSPPPTPNTSDELTHLVCEAEVEAQLKRLPWQSAPGPDRVEYKLWKSTPASVPLLTSLFNTCLLNSRFPDSWKRSNTILIPKRGDASLPGNWRPISLQPTVYKIFAAVMAKRLAAWAVLEKKISPSQKGFLPVEGCFEHSFLMESLMCDAKRRRKDVRILWLDLRNAFGSVSHDLLWFMMNRLQVPTPFIDLCKSIYAGSSQRVRCDEGFTDDIPVNVGIKQGCPLSPLLFNLALEALLPALDRATSGYSMENGSRLKQLTYADDLCAVATSKDEISAILSIVEEFCAWSGLSLNVGKCGCLSLINSSSRGRYVEPFSPEFSGQPIPALKWEDTYRYLGVEVGRPRSGSADSLRSDILGTVDKILASYLTDWQKMDAINTFALSKATYLLSTSILNRTWAAKLDSDVRKRVKKALRLPTRTICAFFHLPTTLGGLGLHSLQDNLEVASVSRTIKVLSSKDKLVSDISWDQLKATIVKRTGHAPTTSEDVITFLNSPPPRNEASRGDVRSLWSMVRKSLQYLQLELSYEDDIFSLTHHETTVSTLRWPPVSNLMRRIKEEKTLRKVLDSSDQGRSYHLISLHPSSSHWIPTGNYISFAEYKFALRARLNLLPVGTVAKRMKRVTDATCKRCHAQPESLGHVLNACTPNCGLMRERHNAILQRLVKAIHKEGKNLYVEQAISPDSLRPDILLHNPTTGEAVVADVSVPYESGPEAFNKARAEKVQKYEGLRVWMLGQDQYTSVSVYAFLVGSLGSWDPQNSTCLRALGISQAYTRLFSKLCGTEAIKGSHAIWRARSSPSSRPTSTSAATAAASTTAAAASTAATTTTAGSTTAVSTAATSIVTPSATTTTG